MNVVTAAPAQPKAAKRTEVFSQVHENIIPETGDENFGAKVWFGAEATCEGWIISDRTAPRWGDEIRLG